MSYNFETDGLITFKDQYLSAGIPISESGVTGLDGAFTAASIVGALNEVKSEVVAESLWDRTGTVLSPQNAGDSVNIDGTDETASLLSVVQTPTGAITNTIVSIRAEGANWSGGKGLEITSADSSCVPFAVGVTPGSPNVTINRSGHISMAGDLTLSSGGSFISTSNGDISVVPHGTGVFMCGTGSPTHLTPTSGEAYFQGNVEVDGIFNADDAIYLEDATNYALRFFVSAATYGSISCKADQGFYWGLIGGDAKDNNQIIIGTEANRNNDYGHNPASANPTLFIHSVRPATESAMEYGSKTHDGDDVIHSVGKGGHVFKTDAQKARGLMTLTGFPVADETFVINATTITFKADGSGDINHCTIAGSASAQVTNIVTTLNECSEAANLTAWDGPGDTVVVEWDTAGVAGNAIVWTEAATNVAVDGTGTLGTEHAGIEADILMDVRENQQTLFPLGGRFEASCRTSDGVAFSFGSGSNDGYLVHATQQSVDSLALNVGEESRSLLIVGQDLSIGDYGHAQQDNPTLFIHSNVAAGTATNQWISLAHDQTNGVINTGIGNVNFETGVKFTSGTIRIIDNLLLSLGGSVTDGYLVHSTVQTAHSLCLCVGDDSSSLLILDQDLQAGDYGHVNQTNPTVFVHSATAAGSATDQWISFAHNTTNGVIATGVGNILLDPFTDVEIAAGHNLKLSPDEYIYAGSAALNGAFMPGSLAPVTSTYPMILTGSDHESIFIAQFADAATNFDHGAQTDPTLYIQSADVSAGVDQYAEHAWDIMGISGSFGSRFTITAIEEEVELIATQTQVQTSGNLAPPDSLLWGVVCRVTQAPTGGATLWDLGPTGGGGGAATLIDDAAVALGTKVNSAADNDGTQLPLLQGNADTLLLVANGAVTGASLKVRIIMFYAQFIEPTS